MNNPVGQAFLRDSVHYESPTRARALFKIMFKSWEILAHSLTFLNLSSLTHLPEKESDRVLAQRPLGCKKREKREN